MAQEDTELDDLMNELYANAAATPQTGRFIPMAQTNMSPRLLGSTTRSTSLSSPVTTTTSNKRDRTTMSHQESDSTITITVPKRPIANETYQSRTMGSHNIKRMAILPLFPTTNVNIEKISASPHALILPAKIAHLLLSNVPIGLLSPEYYARMRRGTYPTLFKLDMHPTTTTAIDRNDSFLLCLYNDLYNDLSQRLKVDISILDYNMIRLRLCVDQVVEHYQLNQTMLNMNELACALEFYLQIDGLHIELLKIKDQFSVFFFFS